MAGQLTIDTLRASSGVLSVANGMTGIAKAWVNFNGTNGTNNNSFNVSSVTRNTTGDYTITFSTAMPNANYTIGFMVGNGTSQTSGAAWVCALYSTATTLTTSVRILCTYTQTSPAGMGAFDANPITISIVGN